MPKGVNMRLTKSALMQFLAESHMHSFKMTCQGPLLLGVFPNLLLLHNYLIKTENHIMLLELDMSLSIVFLYNGLEHAHNHVTQILLADLHNHEILVITDPAPRQQMQFQEVIGAPIPALHCLLWP